MAALSRAAKFNMGELHRLEHQWDLALDWFGKAQEAGLDADPYLHARMGCVLFAEGQFTEAKRAFGEAVRLAGDKRPDIKAQAKMYRLLCTCRLGHKPTPAQLKQVRKQGYWFEWLSMILTGKIGEKEVAAKLGDLKSAPSSPEICESLFFLQQRAILDKRPQDAKRLQALCDKTGQRHLLTHT
ncbi:MAG: tetratricopeptide repeat protein, partial [Alphaproteobacteria bacterium]